MKRPDAPRGALLLLATLLVAVAGCGRPAPARALQTSSLDGEWSLLADPADEGRSSQWAEWLSTGELPGGLRPAPGPVRSVQVPGALEQVPELIEYDGVVWMWRDVNVPPLL